MSNIKEGRYKLRLQVSVNLVAGIWSPSCTTPSSSPAVVNVVVRTRPRSIPLAMITTRKSIHVFPLLSYMAMRLRLAAHRAAGALLLVLLLRALCSFHYRLFGATGTCSHCSKTIPPLEMVMRAREHIYHLECFACQVCQYRFCVGDKFFLHFHVVLCEADYYDVTSIFQQIPYYT